MKATNAPLSVDDVGQDKALLQDYEHDRDSTEETSFLAEHERNQNLWSRSRSWLWLWLLAAILTVGVISTSIWHYAVSSPRTNMQPKEPQLAIDLHPEDHMFRQPKTLTFQWNITSGYLSPDGTRKQIYLVNGKFPGPLIEARTGDHIIVQVTNSLPDDEGVSLHWHGLQMRGHNAMDGAVGITQCPIPAGQNFTYDFLIGDEEHGTFWWHSHAHLQRADGLYGGLVVHKPTDEKPMSHTREALLLVGDWFHSQQKDVLSIYESHANLKKEPILDGVLVNGQGQHHCRLYDPNPCSSGGPSDLLPILRSAETTRLRIVNTGTIAGLSFAIDDATLKVIEVDGGCPVETLPVRSLGIVYPGERIDALLDWTSPSQNASQLRIKVDEENFKSWHQKLDLDYAFPALPESRNSSIVDPPEGIFQAGNDVHFNLANLTSSSIESNFAEEDESETVLFFVKTMLLNMYHGKPVGHLNATFWKPQEIPLLALNRSSWDDHQNMPFISTSAKPKRVNLIINNNDDGAHAFHLHGNNFYVLSSFQATDRRDIPGNYNPYQPERGARRGWLNYKNPLRKDTVVVPSMGYVWVTFTVDNPGLWLLHCHMMVHQASGMAAGFHVGVEDDYEHLLGQDATALRLCNSK
ncbi:hypothetical protein NLG97_g5718 [Lecanicillium saksenae]|uniref:Uncharacterized protein n=1 Tax=Lecanicillium saksenae TaxID=468837 RepID=A0ACC1QRM5_9HYPO|nr:hypothetical protein NLG97_g5718 [Lecanicillium saksenae]